MTLIEFLDYCIDNGAEPNSEIHLSVPGVKGLDFAQHLSIKDDKTIVIDTPDNT